MANKPTIIGLCGSKGAGKDTTAKLFVEILGRQNRPAQRLAIADYLKDTVAGVFHIDPKHFYDQRFKEVEMPELVDLKATNLEVLHSAFGVTADYDKHIRPFIGKIFVTGREFIQFVGFDFLRVLEPQLLVRRVVEIAARAPEVIYFVTDMRFTHEFEFFRENSAVFFPIYVKNERAETRAAGDSHISERQLHEFKGRCDIIINEGTTRELQEQVTRYTKERLI